MKYMSINDSKFINQQPFTTLTTNNVFWTKVGDLVEKPKLST